MSVVPNGVGNAPFSSLAPIAFNVENAYAQARAVVKIDGRWYNLKSFEISKNSHGATNTAHFVVPMAGNPDWSNQLFRDSGKNQPVYVEIWAGFPSNPSAAADNGGMTRRFYGVVDQYQPHDLSDTEFQCRSIAAPMLSDRISTAIQTLTTVQFIKQTAAQYNVPVHIDPELENGSFTLARVYAQDFVVGLKNLVKWDVMLRCAIWDDADLWEDDGQLYYYHPWNVPRKLLSLNYGTNVMSFTGIHSPQFSRNVRVQVHSYSPKVRTSTTARIDSLVGGGITISQVTRQITRNPTFGQNAYTSTSISSNGTVSTTSSSSTGGSANSSSAPISESGMERYDFYIPGLTPQECNQLAQAFWRQISMHEYQGSVTLAVTPEFLPYIGITAYVVVNGYAMNQFNTKYWPRRLTESFAMADPGSNQAQGWIVTLEGVNHTLPQGAV